MANDIERLLEKWWESKQLLAEYDKKCDKYKKIAEKIMIKRNINTFSSKKYTVTRRQMRKRQLLKNAVPRDLWEKYATDSTYHAFFLTEK